ncbi:MAG: polymer-forming cytoskeletal protein [Geothrix sp.]|nr:polymer-forming cytoskeletal protein [Geothrix sp.]
MFNLRKPEPPKPPVIAKPLPPSGNDLPAAPAADEPSPAPDLTPPSLKETPMARSPFAPPMPPSPPSPIAGPGNMPMRNVVSPRDEEQPRRTLVVGRGISVQGTVQDAERLVVEGTVEANMINGLAELSIAHGGVFKGEVEVDEAEVAGTIDGTLTARHALIVRATGRVLGIARCRRLQVEDGGQITGRIEMITNATETPAEDRINGI